MNNKIIRLSEDGKTMLEVTDKTATSITIPDGVKYIGDFVFFYCRELISVTIPDSVTSIGNHVFSYCSKLQSITIPDSIT